eukprot:4118412-Amphidinium_carterae.1
MKTGVVEGGDGAGVSISLSKGPVLLPEKDPSAAVGKKLKKLGHSTGLIYEVYPAADARCQSGWQLSFTPHHWRHPLQEMPTRVGTIHVQERLLPGIPFWSSRFQTLCVDQR